LRTPNKARRDPRALVWAYEIGIIFYALSLSFERLDTY
jgi:hypothetical protein